MRVAFLAVVAVALSGCASTQVNLNTVDLASHVEGVRKAQVLDNLSMFLNDQDAMPSQVEINAGTVTTTDSVNPLLNDVLAKAKTFASLSNSNGKSLVRTDTRTTSLSATGQWTQGWTLTPITDGDHLRRLRALYLFATLPGPTSQVDALKAYPPILLSVPRVPGDAPRQFDDQIDRLIPDPYFFSGSHAIFKGNRDEIWDDTNNELKNIDAAHINTTNLCLHVSHTKGANMEYLGLSGASPIYGNRACLTKFILLLQDAIGETYSPTSVTNYKGTTTTPHAPAHPLSVTITTPQGVITAQ